MKIGNIELDNKVVLGPMAGVTDMSFRTLCKQQGASLMFTEMISAKGLYYRNRNSIPLLQVTEEQRPIGVQLFGSEPELMAQEALKLQDGPYDIFDINMGCPMPKIVNNGEGSALMLNPKLVGEIVAAMTRTLKKPVTVKIRKGFDNDHINAVEIARIAEDNGAAAITVHGRTREEYYSGKADWDIIRQVKEAVKIPVIGSGDVRSGEDAEHMLKETGCDAVMVARAARGNPWIFSEIIEYLNTGRKLQRPSLAEIKRTIRIQLEMMTEQVGEWSAVRQMRQHVAYYSAGFPDSTTFRRNINHAASIEEFLKILSEWNAN